MLSTTVVEIDKIYEYASQFWPYKWSLPEHTHMSFMCGSRGWGTHSENSDFDFVKVVIPPAEAVLGVDVFDSWHHQDDTLDLRVYSLRKFTLQLMKCNPNAVELLFLDEHKHHHTVFANFLMKAKDQLKVKRTISTLLHAASSRSPTNPEGKQRKELVERYGYDVKSAAHSLRWLIFAQDLLRDDNPCSTLTRKKADMIMRVQNGEYTFENFQSFFDNLKEKVVYELETSAWPNEFDTSELERGLVESMRIFM